MLAELLRPNWLMECTLAELPLEALQERGIQALILDVDLANILQNFKILFLLSLYFL
mgnify:CR=1 FL=1